MNSSMSSTLRPATVICTVTVPSRSTLGRSDVMRTSSGSVVSKLVQQICPRKQALIDDLVRLARRARNRVELFGVDGLPCLRRMRAELLRARCQPRPTRFSARTWRLVSRTICVRLKIVKAATTSADRDERAVDAALVVERTSREVGAQHDGQAACSRASRPTSGASASSSSVFAVIRSIRVAALRGSMASTRVSSRCSSARRR